jgi:hypothetical protein
MARSYGEDRTNSAFHCAALTAVLEQRNIFCGVAESNFKTIAA